MASQDVWKLQKRQSVSGSVVWALIFTLACGMFLIWVAATERSLYGADWLSWLFGSFCLFLVVFIPMQWVLQSRPILFGEGDELRLRRTGGLGVHRIQGCTIENTTLVVEYDKDDSAIVRVSHDGKQYSSLFPGMKIAPDWEESFYGWLSS